MNSRLLSAVAIMAVLVLAIWPARADDPEGQYLHLFDLIQQGDTLKKNGQIDNALAKFREAQIGFNIGQGTQDIGFRNSINILFTVSAAVKVILHVKDDDGSPTMASFLITDGIERILDDSVTTIANADLRLVAAEREFRPNYTSFKDYKVPARLIGIYPLPSRRVAASWR